MHPFQITFCDFHQTMSGPGLGPGPGPGLGPDQVLLLELIFGMS